ncbi:Aldo/keto reductase [Coniochaeta hoffmannii]|uniref:Aldo/keto reductase n=1 Tax=Coniochaeta hoffmannii TaxID=91930 RepID=A0AA38RLR9_9PEZI|nr:Aldo/keto reductase [Coniochaeta hoffmannii]
MSPNSVPTRVLGKNGPAVPALGLGLMGLTYEVYGSYPNDDERFTFLDRAVELGATFWDTSDLYGDGEELIGKWFKRTGKRDQIFLATKFGYIKGSKTFETDSSAAYCKKCCDESLKRLGIDSIDLYYLHSANRNTPIEETMRALAELQAEGKIKHIGLSSVSSATLRRAVKIAPVAAVQTEYSVFDRSIEGPAGTDLLATCRELGIAVVCATPLGRGILTATFASGEAVGDKDARGAVMPRFGKENREKNVPAVSQFKAVADKKGCTVAQLALAWLLKQGDDIIPIPGTKRVKYLEENWDSLRISLSDEEEAEIRALVGKLQIAGGSVPPAFEGFFFMDTKEETT